MRNSDPELSMRVDRGAEWRARLAVWSAGALSFLALSGLCIWLLPFGRLNQLNVLLHTLAGLVFLVPVVVYCIRHWRVYREQVLTHNKFLGYVSLGILAMCGVSGLVLTYQPLFDIRISYLWRSIHAWTTVGLLVLGLPHILIPLFRDSRARLTEGGAPIWASAKHLGRGTLILTVLFGGVLGLAYFAYEPPRLIEDFPSDYDLWEPKNPLYGKNRPFAPSLARTSDNRPIDARILAGSEGCGTSGCHEQIVKEWRPSAHRYAAMDKAFQAIQLTMAKQNGPTSTRYCGGCHDPISLFSGTKNISADEQQLTALEGYREGISCLVCHAVRETDIKGNAHFSIKAPPRYIGELEYDQTRNRSWQLVRDFLIRAYPREHVEALSKVMFKKPEYCAACHKQFVDEEINKVGWVQLQNQYDNWRTSKWARDQKQPERITECRECHMPLVTSTDPAAGDTRDYNRSATDQKHRSHRFIGGNQLMPALLNLEGADEQVRLTQLWLQGKFRIPEIEDKWHSEVPYQRRMRYNLFMALNRAGKTAEAQAELDRFRQLENSTVRVVEAPKSLMEYLKQGKYAEAIPETSTGAPSPDRAPSYSDVAQELGLNFQHHGTSQDADIREVLQGKPQPGGWFLTPANRTRLMEALGSGAAFCDYNNDGRLDVFLVDAGRGGALYEQGDDGRFQDISRKAGLINLLRPGMACAWADYDNDGWADLLVTYYGAIQLYRNRQGRFEDVTVSSGLARFVQETVAYMGAAFVDVDHDGDTDIYVACLLDLNKASPGETIRFPADFEGQPNLLFRNNSQGRFSEIAREARADGGNHQTRNVWFADVDEDRAVDFLLLDAGNTPTILLNRKDGSFLKAAQAQAKGPMRLPLGESRA
jgi:hypothetical protein